MRFGDLDVDLSFGRETPLVTINDREAGVVKIRKSKSKEADEVSRIIVLSLEDRMPKSPPSLPTMKQSLPDINT
ncbi:MAG: hypothetical protein ACK5JS_07785 [Mangrovibacterium sp.]